MFPAPDTPSEHDSVAGDDPADITLRSGLSPLAVWAAGGGRGRQVSVQPPYGLRDHTGRETFLTQLTGRVAGWDGPVQVWHGPPPPVPAAAGDGEAAALTRRLAASSRPRVTMLIPQPPQSSTDTPAEVVGVRPATSPAAAAERPGHVSIGGGFAAVWAATSWPAAVTPGWLRPLTDLAHHTVLHVRPMEPPAAQRLLRRRLSALASTRLLDEKAGRLEDPATTVAAQGAADLREALARGHTRLLHVQLLLVLTAPDPGSLDAAGRSLADTARALLTGVAPLRWQHRPGYDAALPGGRPLRWPWRLLDAATLAATVPHPVGPPQPVPTTAVSAPTGPVRRSSHARPDPVLVGVEPESGAPLCTDRWAEQNHTRLVVGTSGAGKSYAAKLELMRQRAAGARAVVIDPEGEFGALCSTLGGLTLTVGEQPVGLDPVGLATRPAIPAAEGLSVLTSWAAALIGQPLGPVDIALLDRALAVLRADHPAARPGQPTGPVAVRVPALPGEGGASAADLLAVISDLTGHPPFAGADLPARLSPAAGGTVGGLFAPNPELADPPDLVCFDLRAVAGRVRPAVMSCVLAWTWAQTVTTAVARPTLLVLDEAHLLLDDTPAADLLAQFARRARKYTLGLDVITQRLSDFLGQPAGQAVLANTATKLLLGTEDHERAAIAAGLGLTAAETGWLTPGRSGRGLLISPRLRSPVHVIAGPAEHQLASAPPRR